jgi:hypothetical protein
MLNELKAHMAEEDQIEKEVSVNFAVPKPLIDLIAQGARLLEATRLLDLSKINLMFKKTLIKIGGPGDC